ncbi:MAG TPA: adenylate/guanylate cyclase domain-containing protein [Chloroflexota bacterium]|nr:adenylate/guanylate cyclase domain-containing protein [Chloroflexota bacterium]
MRCSSCGFDNPDETKFCGECAASLTSGCPACGFENPAGFKFCGQCAAPLTRRAAAAQQTLVRRQPRPPELVRVGDQLAGPAAAEAERRQLTVMFCDLVGSTALSERLDPEELRDLLRAYQDACARVIDRFDGYIAKYLGDGLLVYFGYPEAREDAADRAVRAGLGIVEEMARLDANLGGAKGVSLAVRIGIHSGLVVVGEMGAGQQRESSAIVGEAPNVAARLQGLAEPNSVVISGAIYSLIAGFFTCQPLGSQTLKGLSHPLEAYRVLGESGTRSRLEMARGKGLTPLVGRGQEVELLLDRWERVRDGSGQVVLLNGEAGIGKSRLVWELNARVANEPHAWLECRCSPYHQNSALYPVIDVLQRVLRFSRDDSPQAKLGKLEATLRRYGLSLSDQAPLFASMLSLPLDGRYSPPDLPPEKQKQKTLEALLFLLLKMARERPLLFAVEDLHWADPSTIELLDLLIDQVPTAPILALLTFRPDFSPPWGLRGHFTYLTLSRLPRKQAQVMVERVAGDEVLPPAVLQQVATRTDGVPLFVEELTKMLLESGLLEGQTSRDALSGPLPQLAIPITLQDSLLARLDRLGTAKEVAQWGATLGREFSYELLQVVSALDEETLQRQLARLVEAELLYQRGVPPHATYLFKHALVQETGYESLLKSKRQQYHQLIAQALAEQFPQVAETEPELLAHHYTEAGLKAQAIDYWQRAGQRAIERSANAEANAHLTRGLEVLKGLPDAPERLQQELELQTTLGLVLMPIKGYGSSEVEAVYKRALELCRRIGKSPHLFSVLRGLWEFYDLRGDIPTARELAEELLRLASSVNDAGLQVVAHNALGETLVWPGELALAREHLEQGIALYDPRQHRALAFRHGGYDSGVVCRSWAAHTLWYLGYPDQALTRCHEALALARELSHPHTLIFALSHAAVLHQSRREAQAAQDRAEAAIGLASEQGFAFWVAFTTITRGWALAEQGQAEEGIAQIRRGLVGYQAGGAELEVPLWLGLLAGACGKVGQIEEGLAALAEGLAVANKNGTSFYNPELHRLRGELLLSRTEPDESQAEFCFHQAIDLARRQQAKSLELRAATSLGRLWQRQGRRSEAHEMVADAYGWFTEGSDTADLKAASALIEKRGVT